MDYQRILLCISFACAATTLVLLRKNVVRPLHAAWWLVVACCGVLAGLFPTTIDAVGHALGVSSQSTLFLAIGVVLMLIRLLLADLEHCKIVLQQRRMHQHIARLGLRVRQLEQGKTPARSAVAEGKPVPAAKKYE